MIEEHPTPMSQALRWWHSARRTWLEARDKGRLPEQAIHQLSDVTGVPRTEIAHILGQPDGSTQLLYRKLEAFNLNPQEILLLSPLLLADLEHNCQTCPDKARCAADMTDHPNPPGWDSYCPNAGTLKTLT